MRVGWNKNLSGLFQIEKAVVFMRIHKWSVELEFMRAGFSQVYATEQIACVTTGNIFNFSILDLSITACVSLFMSGLGLCELSVESWKKTDIQAGQVRCDAEQNLVLEVRQEKV